jgi:succinate dehydrogenase / fumarate reductase, cytochrome b subunit
MLVSILHRATGVAMGTAGIAILTWWLAALAGGAESYDSFRTVFLHPGVLGAIGWLVGVGYTLVFFLHLGNGIRHLFMDAGANFELRSNKRSSLAVMIGAVAVTALFWLYILVTHHLLGAH